MTLTDQQWATVRQMLVSLSQKDTTQLHPVEEAIRDIEGANGIRSYVVVARWLDRAHPHPRSIDNPQQWPPEMMVTITATSPITTDDILAEVELKSSDPIAIYATRDPTGRYGWKKLEDW